MAVEARHRNLFPPQLVQERDLVNSSHQGNMISSCEERQTCFPAVPFPTTLLENHTFYQQVVCDSINAKISVNTDSGLTCNVPTSRKRCRDSVDELYAASNFLAAQKNNSASQIPSFVGENIFPQIQQYQLEIDAIIFQHTKKIRLELQERQKQQTKLLVAAIEEGVMKKMKEKDEQIQKMAKLNILLQEKVKTLYAENQLWKELARTNEARAISLRTNLEQALAKVDGSERISDAEEEEGQSCCASNNHGRHTDGGETAYNDGHLKSFYRRCRGCREREACVLLLPCRHLCLCSVCCSSAHQVQTCPVCNSTMNATLHVNMPS